MKKILLFLLVLFVGHVMHLMGQATTNNGSVYVGYYASDQTANFGGNYDGNPTDAGNLGLTNVYIGYGNSYCSNNYAIFNVGSDGAYYLFLTNLYVNYQGSSNSAFITNGTMYVQGNCYLGYQPGSSNGLIEINEGSQSYSTTLSGNPNYGVNSTNFIGYNGVNNTFEIGPGSQTSFTYTIIGGQATNDFSNIASNNTLVINGSFSSSSASNFDDGMFMLSSGNKIICSEDGQCASWNNNGDFHLYGYSNTIIMSNGGLETASCMYIGGTNGINLSSNFSNNTINIVNGGGWYNSLEGIGTNVVASSGNTIYVSGYNANKQSTMETIDDFLLGLYGSSNTIYLSNSGYWSNYGEIYLGTNAAVTTSNNIIINNADLQVTGYGFGICIGNSNGSSGALYLTNGGAVYTAGDIDVYNGDIVMNGTGCTISANDMYVYNGNLYYGENNAAFNNMQYLVLGTAYYSNNFSNSLYTNASLYLSTNGDLSMKINNLYFNDNNVHIYNINPNNAQQIICATNLNGNMIYGQTNTNSTNSSITTTNYSMTTISLISNVSLDNNVDPLIVYESSNFFNPNFSSNFTIANITGYIIGNGQYNGSNCLYFNIPTNANLTVAQSINETNDFSVNTLTFTAGSFTDSYFDNGGLSFSTLNMLSNSSLFISPNTTLTVSNLDFSISSHSTTSNFSTNLYIPSTAALYTANAYMGVNSGVSVLMIETGKWYNATNFYLGYNGGGTNLLILNNYATLSNSGIMTIGSNGNNVLDVEAADVYSSNWIMQSSSSCSNAIYVNGGKLYAMNNSTVNSNADLNYSLIIGYTGSHDYLCISNGGYVSNSLGVIGYSNTASSNYGIVTGTNSEWVNTNGFYVGFMGGKNQLLISNSGAIYVNGPQSYVGLASSSNTVMITGTNSLFSNQGTLWVGYRGSYNQIMISNGGMLVDNQTTTSSNFYPGAAILGAYSNNNSVTIYSNSYWSNYDNLYIGVFGSSNSVTNNGGTLYAPSILINYNTNGNYPSGSNNCLIINSGTVTSSGCYVGANYNSSSASIILSSASASLFISGDLINYGYISNGGKITVGTLYNYGTIVGNTIISNTAN